MRKFFILSLLCCTLLSCTKKTDEGETSTANFIITGVQDADLTNSSDASFSLPIAVVPNGGTKDTVTLSADGLPQGVNAFFTPSVGSTPFSARVLFTYDYSGKGGIYPVTITGNGKSGKRTYKLNLTLPEYKGWKLDDIIYSRTAVFKTTGDSDTYPSVRVTGGGAGVLTITFGLKRGLPTKNTTYRITGGGSDTANAIQIGMTDVAMIYNATGVGSPTGTFTFDTLGKFTFKCSDVEVTDGIRKKKLSCSFSE